MHGPDRIVSYERLGDHLMECSVHGTTYVGFCPFCHPKMHWTVRFGPYIFLGVIALIIADNLFGTRVLVNLAQHIPM